MKEHDKKHGKERRKRNREFVRSVILKLVGGGRVKCGECGCDNAEIIEINHINGGGNKELQNGKFSNTFYWAIYSGRRNIDDLNLLCKVCNARHALELIHGELPYKILWKSND